jgi:hypothetical protein
MNNSKTILQAIKVKGHIGPDRKLEIAESLAELPEGDVEVVLLYPQKQSDRKSEHSSPLAWPALDGGRYLGGSLRREEIYGSDGR